MLHCNPTLHLVKMKTTYSVLPLLFLILADCTAGWRGNVATRTKSRRVRQRYCAYSIRGRCCVYRYRTRTVYYQERYCKSGWTHNGDQNCNIPICNPPCQNGGTCSAPNTCRCRNGFEGRYCQGKQCDSFQRPCYPGRCENNVCICTTNFTGVDCLNFNGMPSLDSVRTRFSFIDATNNFTEMYQYNVDATGSDDIEIIWTNQDSYNKLNATFNVDFDLISLGLPSLPSYIDQFELGVVSGSVTKTLTKLSITGIAGRTTSVRKAYPCDALSALNPMSNSVVRCNFTETDFPYRLDSGDEFLFNFTSTIGGIRRLRDNSDRISQTYIGQTDTAKLQFNFDFSNPDHCIGATCRNSPLSLAKDITNTTIVTQWSGWTDTVSGVLRYAWEIFKLEPDMSTTGRLLHEPEPLSPVFITEVNHTDDNKVYSFEYTPEESGMYSIILEVSDRANNSKYVRRLVLFDKDSNITVDANNRIFSDSAHNRSDFRWQITIGDGVGGTTRISVRWTSYFMNRFHAENYLLNTVKPYPPQLNDFGRRGQGYKKIDSSFDDNEGSRNISRIPNYQGIVRYDVAADKLESLSPPLFREVTPFREFSELALTNVMDGSAAKIWVRAHDVMGNTKTDSTVLRFDSSEPVLFQEPVIVNNIIDGMFPFSSRVALNVTDFHSGIAQVNFRLVMADTGYVKKEDTIIVSARNASDCLMTTCYTVPSGELYQNIIQFDVDHCWMTVEQDRLDFQVMELQMEVFNSAFLSVNTLLNISNIRSLTGIQDYFGPRNVSTTRQLDTGVSLTWVHAPTCYERMTILVEVQMPDGSLKNLRADKDAVRFDITGLAPLTRYETKLQTVYRVDSLRNITSTPTVFFITTIQGTQAQTGTDGGLGQGGVAALIICLLLLLIIILILVVLWRTGRLEALMKRNKHMEIAAIHHGMNASNELATLRRDRVDGDFDMEQSLYLDRSQISLEKEIKRGRFAIIYLAKLRGTSQELHTVAAKVLHENWTSNDEQIMREKMEFYVNEVGQHPNVLRLIGGVQDPNMGAFMILEYCENGTLKEYLQKNKNHVTEDLQDKLFQFAYETCRGMEYLSGKGIVHRRLAARNILLTFRYTVKITGFGPLPKNDSEQEMIPVKWLPPECIIANSTRDATTETDVWSYGVVLWEIFSMGDNPYSDVETQDILQYLSDGKRLRKPEYSDAKIYDIMKSCWRELEGKRPRFLDLRADYDVMFRTSVANLPELDTQEIDDIYFDASAIRR